MSSIDDLMMADKGFWQKPEKGQDYGINFWIQPDSNVPEFGPEKGESLQVEIRIDAVGEDGPRSRS